MQIALNDVLKDDGKILRVDADFGPDTFEMKLGKYPITRKTPVSLVLTNKGKRNLLIQGKMDLTILYIHGYDLDVDELVYSEILVNWPLRVLCKEDCKGICSICGKNLNHGTCDCDHTDLDPRMAQIRDIFNKFKEV